MPEPDRFQSALEQVLRQQPAGTLFRCGRLAPPPPMSHVVGFPRLEFPLSGCYDMEMEDSSGDGPVKVNAKPGDIIFAGPNCWNRPAWQRPVRLLSILFGKKQTGLSLVRSPGPAGILQAEKMALPQPLSGPGERILAALLEIMERGAPLPAAPELVRALLYCLQQCMREPVPARLRKGKGRMEEICVHLQQHYSETLSREETARLFGITPGHLSRLFKIHGYMSFSNYLTCVRMDRAKFLLKTYRMRVEEVAWQCGYGDSAYFCRVFKHFTRRTPGEYRRMTAETEQ